MRKRDLVRITKRTSTGVKTFDAVVTSIERVYSDPHGVIETIFGYEPIDPLLGSNGASRIPCKGGLGTLKVEVLAHGYPTRAERWQGARPELLKRRTG